MKVFHKECKLDNCGDCGVYGLMQHYIIKFKNCGFHYLLCRECIKDKIYQICQKEILTKKEYDNS